MKRPWRVEWEHLCYASTYATAWRAIDSVSRGGVCCGLVLITNRDTHDILHFGPPMEADPIALLDFQDKGEEFMRRFL